MTTEDQELVPKKAGGRKLKLIGAIVVALLIVGGGGAFAWRHFRHPSVATPPTVAAIHPLIVVIPTVMSNLDAGDGRPRYVRVNASLQIADERDAAKITLLMPQIQDAFQSYLHETRPDELSGSGIYRLREALLAQITNIAAPVHVRDLFFREVLVQ